MIVVDASALLELLLNTASAARVADRLFGLDAPLATPDAALAGARGHIATVELL